MSKKLPPKIARALLDKLISDEGGFRARYVADARSALAELGYTTPEKDVGVEGKDPVLPLLTLKGGLASPETLAERRMAISADFDAQGEAESAAMAAPHAFCA